MSRKGVRNVIHSNAIIYCVYLKCTIISVCGLYPRGRNSAENSIKGVQN